MTVPTTRWKLRDNILGLLDARMDDLLWGGDDVVIKTMKELRKRNEMGSTEKWDFVHLGTQIETEWLSEKELHLAGAGGLREQH